MFPCVDEVKKDLFSNSNRISALFDSVRKSVSDVYYAPLKVKSFFKSVVFEEFSLVDLTELMFVN